jgi:hypothetical protein
MILKDKEKIEKCICRKGKPDRETVYRWVINFQHDEVMRRYGDIGYGEKFRELFSKYMYPDYEHRGDYESRNELFRWVARVYRTGKIDRLLGAARIVFRGYIDALKGEKDIPFYLDAVIESYDIAKKMDNAITDTMWETAKSEGDLNEGNYAAAFRECSTWEERLKQIDNLVVSGEYAKKIIERGGLIDFVIERLPQIPLLTHNKFVHALNETIGMVKAAYRTFKQERGRLDTIRDTIREREIRYLEKFMGPRPQDVDALSEKDDRTDV